MDKVPVFRQEDRHNLEFARHVVLHRLKHDREWKQLYQWDMAGSYIRFDAADGAQRASLVELFTVLAHEVMWELMIEGVIRPGYFDQDTRLQPELPWFHVTDYGRKVLEEERFLPHDPTGYLDQLQAAARTTTTRVAITYVEEALRCFNRGCHVAAVLLLGVAAESIFLELCTVVRASLKNPADEKDFDKLPDQVKPKHRWIVDKYRSLPRPLRRAKLPESFDVRLPALYELIRLQRNDLGHPQTTPPQVTREDAFVFFRLFGSYVADVEAFAAYCMATGL
jgi:hypothetical protein